MNSVQFQTLMPVIRKWIQVLVLAIIPGGILTKIHKSVRHSNMVAAKGLKITSFQNQHAKSSVYSQEKVERNVHCLGKRVHVVRNYLNGILTTLKINACLSIILAVMAMKIILIQEMNVNKHVLLGLN